MIQQKIDKQKPKGWFSGPWDSSLPIPVGYANEGINEKHFHSQMYEIYLVAKGEATIVVNDVATDLEEGDMVAIEPGEVHTFINSSEDYLHFVIQTPFIKEDKTLSS
jgi:quercetin dioxygenase-like cupin family protein